MTTESEAILARYKQIEREADAFGRIIGVRRLKPSEQTRVAGMCSDLPGADEVVNEETGDKISVPHRMPLLIASAVCEIGEAKVIFPRNRAELDAIYDRLDTEGLSAASRALTRLAGAESLTTEEQKEEAKN